MPNDVSRLSRQEFYNSPLHKFMQEVPTDEAGRPAPRRGLPQSGEPNNPEAPALGFVNAEYGVPQIKDFLLKHDDDGSVSEGEGRVSRYEKNLVYTMLTDPVLRGLCDPTGIAALRETFGIDEAAGPAGPARGRAPVDAGKLNLPEGRMSMIAPAQLRSLEVQRLPDLFAREISTRKEELLSPQAGTREERSAKLLGLLRDYAKALWSKSQGPQTMAAADALLDVLEKDTQGVGMALGKKDFCGAGFGAAQRIVLGGDPNDFRFALPEAHLARETTYLAMDGKMAGPMAKVDEVRAALGLEKAAERHEKASPLDWIAGNEAGHDKVAGSAREEEAISSTGIRWANVMFPGDAEIRDLPATEGFEMAIDFLDAFGGFVRCDPAAGDRFVVEHKDGETPVKLEKVVERDGDGQAVSWSAKFTNADTGEAVDPAKVRGRFVDGDGRPKSDGETGGSISLWWWGFCDRNTNQGIYKAQFGLPELDQDEVKTRSGVTFSKDEAQSLIDAHVGDMVTNEQFWGFRFNDEPQIVMLKDGRQIRGRVGDEIFAARPGGSKPENREMYGDLLLLHNTPERRLLGALEVTREGAEAPEEILARDIASIALVDEAEGKVEIRLRGEGDERGHVMEGTIDHPLPWEKAVDQDGKKTLVQDESQPIRGFLNVQLPNGQKQKIDVADINLIAGEQQKENNLAVHLTMVEKLGGFYGQDVSRKETVANSPQHVNGFEAFESAGDETPEWWRGGPPEEGREGPVELGPRDKLVFYRARQAHEPGAEPNRDVFKGWLQVNESTGRIVNQAFADGHEGGEPDFGFGALGPLEWTGFRSSFNPHMNAPLEDGLLVDLMVNGHSALKQDGPESDALAEKLGLPAHWREHRSG